MPNQIIMKDFKSIVRSKEFNQFDVCRMRKGSILTRVNAFLAANMEKRGYHQTGMSAPKTDGRQEVKQIEDRQDRKPITPLGGFQQWSKQD